MRHLFWKSPPAHATTASGSEVVKTQPVDLVCTARRRLSALGPDIGFESDGAIPADVIVPASPKPVSIGIVKSVAFLSKPGRLPNNPHKVNQDRCWIMDILDKSGSMYKFCGVADGHGVHGHNVAEMIRTHLGIHLEKQLPLYGDLKTAMKNSHERMSRDIMSSYLDVSFSGSTAISVLFKGDVLYCANVGDSRAIIGSRQDGKWEATSISRDHKPDIAEEAARIAHHGGRVAAYKTPNGEPVGPARVWLKAKDVPGLAMSRSFGDKVAASVGVVAEPEITVSSLSSEDKFLIIATDGVWEFISNQEAVELVAPFLSKGDTKAAAETLCCHAEQKWINEEDVVDDITAVIIFFKN